MQGLTGFVWAGRAVHAAAHGGGHGRSAGLPAQRHGQHVPAAWHRGALFAWLLWREKEKHRLKEPKEETVTVHPAQHGGNITLTAALWGFIGAKLFHWLESPQDFLDLVAHPNATSGHHQRASPCTAASSWRASW
jgi:phosphatidylglycerol:prolipoprotein diacylglycerol transferase